MQYFCKRFNFVVVEIITRVHERNNDKVCDDNVNILYNNSLTLIWKFRTATTTSGLLFGKITQLLLVMMLTLHAGIDMGAWKGLQVSAQVRSTSVIDPCSTKRGTAPHESFCDKYYSCVQNITAVKDCPNGLVYNGGGGRAGRGNQLFGPCEYDFNVDCSGRPKRSNCRVLYSFDFVFIHAK